MEPIIVTCCCHNSCCQMPDFSLKMHQIQFRPLSGFGEKGKGNEKGRERGKGGGVGAKVRGKWKGEREGGREREREGGGLEKGGFAS